MHPSLEYALLGVIAAGITFLATPLARWAALRIGAVAHPRDRDVHASVMPRMGGVAIFLGIAIALLVARQMPTLQYTFTHGSETTGVLVAGFLICGLGVIDDRWELDSLTKLPAR